MTTLPTIGFIWLGALTVSSATESNRSTEFHNRPLTRMLVDLFDIVSDSEICLTKIIRGLNDFQNEKTVGLRVYIIHKVGRHFAEFGDICIRFCKWFDAQLNPQYLHQAQLLPRTPEIRDSWSRLNNHDNGYNSGHNAQRKLAAQIKLFCDQLQATKSPDPDLFPQAERFDAILAAMNILLSQFRDAKNILRSFALSNLTIEDFF